MKNKKNILIATNDFPPAEGGMEICAYEIASNLIKHYNIFVLTKKTKIKNQKTYKFPVIRINFPKNFFLKHIKLFFTILYLIIIKKIDLIYLNTWSPLGLSAFLLNKILKINYVVTCHGLDIVEPIKSNFYKKLMNIVLKNASNIIAVSNYTKSLIIKYAVIEKNKITVINNGVNSEAFEKYSETELNKIRKKLGLENNFILLTIARLTPRKNHKTIIESIITLKNQIPEIKYIIVGRGPEKADLKKIVLEKNLSDYIIFTDYVEDINLKYYYYLSDIFVMLSDEIIETGDVEGFGISFIEANICKKIAIGSNIAGCIDAIKENITGHKVDTIEEFKEKILYYYKNKKKLIEISNKAYYYIKNNLDWKIVIKEYIILFENSMKGD